MRYRGAYALGNVRAYGVAGALLLGCEGTVSSLADAGGGADRVSAAPDARVPPGGGSDAAVPGTDAAVVAPDAMVTPAPDAGSARTFPTDRSVYFGASRCGTAGVQLCEDFEGAAEGAMPDASLWTFSTWGTGSGTVESAQHARGRHALHLHAPAMPASVMFGEHRTFPAPGNHFFGRVFVYFEHIPQPFVWNDAAHYPLVHWTVSSATGLFSSGGHDYHPVVRAVGGINRALLINVDGGPDHEYGIDDDMPPVGQESIAEGQWMCFEFEHNGQGINGEMRVWRDGVEHPKLHLNAMNLGNTTGTAWPLPAFDTLEFGFQLYQNYSAIMPGGFDVWLDEIAVDFERIGCAI